MQGLIFFQNLAKFLKFVYFSVAKVYDRFSQSWAMVYGRFSQNLVNMYGRFTQFSV